MSTSMPFRNLTGLLVSILIILIVSGCGGGSSPATQNNVNVSPSAAASFNIVDLVAKVGPVVAVRVGETATLDGSGSLTTSDQQLTFEWSFSFKPDASKAAIQGASTATPTFVADAVGVYMVQLVVKAEGLISQRQIQLVVATIAPDRPTGPFNHQGLSSSCVNCHNGDLDLIPGVSKIAGKSITHFATSNACQACHTPQGFALIPYVDHQEVFGSCSECHNGTIAIGKSEFHTPTDAQCNDCHNTMHFLELEPDGSYDHSNITRSCTGCHNGKVAKGQHETHVVTDTQCGYCHTTVSFLPAYPDHTGPDVIGKRCDSCHGIGQVPGYPVGHPVMSVDCNVCHNVTTFSLGGVFDHSIVDSITQPCAACHNDNNSINARGKASAVPTHAVTSSDCGSCHNTDTFASAFVDHTGIVNNCGSCHGVTAIGKSTNHMPTTPANQDCADCHTPGTFASGTYDHAGVVNGCNTCHDNVISVGKLINHMPTNPDNQDCADCHNTTAFAGATFNHVGIDTTHCALCHNGEISTGMSKNHVPTAPSLDCSDCHDTANFTTFAGITYNHLGINPNNCSSCHDTGIATPKTSNHIPASDDCSVCHDSTMVFTSTTFLVSVHQGITRGCAGCHKSRFLSAKPNLIKSSTHLPTKQDCYYCHTNTGFKPAITPFLHKGITGNCASCHDGTPAYVAVGARGKTDVPVHQNTNGDCAVCHNTTNFADAFVDHTGPDVVGVRCDSCHNGINATGKNAKTSPAHVQTNEDCVVCHVTGGTFANAMFDHTGIVDNCASCHDGSFATGVSQNHIPFAATQDCSDCHNTTAFAGATFDHKGILDNCASCHDGATARGKIPPPNHVPTNGDCSNCHQTTGFIPATFSHAGIVDNCSSCHAAGFATPKPTGHVETNQDCVVCHTTDTFVGAGFNHTGIVDNCASCHGVTAIGKSSNHLTTSLDCHFCHTTATFVGGSWVHDASTAGQCDTCHSNGGGATFKPKGHLSTNVQCDACHSTKAWAPSIFSHDPKGDYPGDHRRDPGCAACHGNSINSTFMWPSPQYAPFCAACHEKDFRSEGDHNGGKSGTVEQNKNCGASGCHKITKNGF
ncbi:MAG: cytochrome c3 family protein [Gammaproteobacteria bacterium]